MTEFYFFIVLKAEKSRIKAPANLVSGESSLPSLQKTTFSLCPHRAGMGTVRGKAFIRTPILTHQDLNLITSCDLNYLLVGPVSKCSHIED